MGVEVAATAAAVAVGASWHSACPAQTIISKIGPETINYEQTKTKGLQDEHSPCMPISP